MPAQTPPLHHMHVALALEMGPLGAVQGARWLGGPILLCFCRGPELGLAQELGLASHNVAEAGSDRFQVPDRLEKQVCLAGHKQVFNHFHTNPMLLIALFSGTTAYLERMRRYQRRGRPGRRDPPYMVASRDLGALVFAFWALSLSLPPLLLELAAA